MGRIPARSAQRERDERKERRQSQHISESHGKGYHQRGPFWQSVFISDSHCGAGCTLGDIAGEWLIFTTATTIHGILLWPQYLVDFAFAYVLGIFFQYLAIAPMRGLALGQGIIAAIKADTLSLTAFEVGLFGWMALMRFVLFQPPIHADSWVYWFMMQIGMILGFLTSYPVNWFLVRTGIKEAM